MEGGELLLTQYLNAGGAIDPTVQVGEVASVVDGRPRELGAVQSMTAIFRSISFISKPCLNEKQNI